MKNYSSVVYDLTQFGVYKISNAIVSADMDSGIAIEVSFDGGFTFKSVKTLNQKFPVQQSRGKVQVKITFNDMPDADIYKVKATGFFQNLEIGTRVTFTKHSTSESFSTTVGENGRFLIYLPRGTYDVWYTNDRNQRVSIYTQFNPEVIVTPYNGLDKENTIEMFLRDVDWAKYTIFDTFADPQKMLNGSAIIDQFGLTDGVTNRHVRYWAVGFN